MVLTAASVLDAAFAFAVVCDDTVPLAEACFSEGVAVALTLDDAWLLLDTDCDIAVPAKSNAATKNRFVFIMVVFDVLIMKTKLFGEDEGKMKITRLKKPIQFSSS